MCTSRPPKVKPVAAAPTANAEVIDDRAVVERDRLRKRMRSQYGRQATVIAGENGGGALPTSASKTALGA